MFAARTPISLLICVPVLILFGAVAGFAQFPFDDFTIEPSTLVQGDCYDAWVTPRWNSMHMDIQYTYNDGPLETIYDWPWLDESGVAHVCTGLDTLPGTYVFVNVRPSGWPIWYYAGKSVTVLPQPTGMSFDAPFAYAGIDHYILTVFGGESMSVRVRFNWNGYENLEGVITTDANGQYDSGLLDHYRDIGPYFFTGIQNAAANGDNWVNISVPYEIRPPQPTSFSLDKTLIRDEGTGGEQTYHIFAANGGDVLLDVQYTIDDGPVHELDRWPWLNRDSPTSWDGHSDDINANTCTIPGFYRFTAVRNTLNTAWIAISPPAELTVIGPGPPQVSGVSPSGVGKGQSRTVTITGEKLCGVTLTTTYPGLDVRVLSSTEHRVVASMSVAAGTVAGNALVTLHAFGGDATFLFAVGRDSLPRPTITSVAPSSALPGTNVTVTIRGINLQDAILTTDWSGLAITHVVPNADGTTVTADFTVNNLASLGNPTISLTTPFGIATTQLFWVGVSALPALSREYIYLGDRVIAVESPRTP